MEVFSSDFKINAVDLDGKIYDKVSRCHGSSPHGKIILDYHSILFPLEANDTIHVVLYKNKSNDNGIPPEYDYVTHGEVYSVVSNEANKVVCKVSFYGLLLDLETDNIDIEDGDKVVMACMKL